MDTNYNFPGFQIICQIIVKIEGNGYETRQSSLLQVIVRFSGLDPAQNTIVVYY